MKRIGKIIMSVGAFISVTGACLICLDGYIPDIKKSHPLMLCRAGAIYKEFK